ncbi:MAG: RNA methyltransferase [Lachnospiraceae bacterium]|nr:RNA methyltransferase [Lachnospiraceae bacterium]
MASRESTAENSIEITSPANQRVRRIAGLMKKRAERMREQVFVIEGIRTLREAPADRVREIYLTEHAWKSLPRKDREQIDHLPCEHYIVTDPVMERLSDTQHPQGILAVVAMREARPEELVTAPDPNGPRTAPLILLLENLQDPGNLGTILRMSEGAGVTGVLLTGSTADPYNPKVVRGTMGSIFRVPFLYLESASEAVRLLKDRGIRLLAADPRGEKAYTEADLTRPVAFLIGNEGAGLTEETLRAADERVTIPMAGKLESLNAGISAAILSFEAARQRRP